MGESDDDLPALFRDSLPDKLTYDLLALAHLSDVEEKEPPDEPMSGPIRRKRITSKTKPYGKKTAEDEFHDQMKELEFRTNAWKPFKKVDK